VTAFEHMMAGIMVLTAAILTKYKHQDFVYFSFFVAFMLLQCSFTGFSPPNIMLTHVLKVTDGNRIIRGRRA